MYNVYLPVVMQGKPFTLGVQIEHHISPSVSQWLIPGRQYQIPVKWRDVETTRGEKNWSAYDADFAALAGQKITVGIKVVPEWARLWTGYIASPPKPDCYTDLVNFILALIERYNPDAIELFNEPDVDRDGARWAEEFFGAWCINSDWYSGGVLYGECLKAIYPIIKGTYPNTRIIAGALIGAIPSSVEFYQGFKGAGSYYDAVSFHKYINLGESYSAAIEFANLINASILSETSITSRDESETLKSAQADYLRYLKSNIKNSSIEVIQWYSLDRNGWFHTDLVRENIPTPAYNEWIL